MSKGTCHNAACRIIQQPIRDHYVGITQQRVLSPAGRQCLVDVGAEKTLGGQSAAFVSHAKKNAFPTRWINQARVRRESLALDHFQQIPNESGNIRGGEELAQLASPLQVVGRRFRRSERLPNRWL